MAVRREVKCINKSNRTNPHERITHIGGDGWKMSEEDAIRAIENGTYSFYVTRGGNTVDVVVATRNGRKYLKTVRDNEQPDNLLSLQECK